MKRLFAVILTVCIILSLFSGVFAAETPSTEEIGNVIVLKIPFPDSIEDFKSWQTIARYKDTKKKGHQKC